MKVKTAVTSLKVEKGCVNIDCKYCTEKGKCNLETILKELQLAKQKINRLENLLVKRLNVYQRQKKKLEQIMEIVKNNQFCQQLIDIKNIIQESENKNE